MNTHAARSAGWRSLLVPALAAALVFGVLCGLGAWQLERKTWKEGLIAAIEARAHTAPVDGPAEPDWSRWSAAEDEFRRVRVTGIFQHDKEVRLHGLMEERAGKALLGYYVFTPLLRSDGSTMLVNRGFVVSERLSPSDRGAGQVQGPATLVGLLRAPERKSLFLPANDPVRGEWFVRDIGEMAAARRLARVAPFYVDADATPNPGGWPRGGQTRMTLPNDHLGYAMTWFGLAASLAGVFLVFARRRLDPAAATGDTADHPSPA